MKKGLFIVIDGVDGSGKGTQIALLHDALNDLLHRTRIHTTAEPSEGPMGKLIRSFLRKEQEAPDGEAMALLFASDRIDHLDREIVPALREGAIVLCDRYVASSLAYQATTMSSAYGGSLDSLHRSLRWIKEINAKAMNPDLSIILDVEPSVAAARRVARGTPAELFEREEFQSRLREAYRLIPSYDPNGNYVFIDASASVREVHASIYDRVLPLVSVMREKRIDQS